MAEYSTCIHEAGHGVAASILNVGYAAVSVKERDGHLGRLTPSPSWMNMMVNDPIDGDWTASSFAIVCLAGPSAEALYMNERLDWPASIDWSQYGSEQDFAIAKDLAYALDVRFEALLEDAAGMWLEDRIWLAVQRVADKLIEKTILPYGEVDRIIGLERAWA